MMRNRVFKRVADIREDLDLTQQELANFMNIKRSVYSKWEREIELMPLTRLNDFCNITKTSMNYVTGLTVKKEKSTSLETLDKKAIGERLRQIRKDLNMTQKQMAEFLNTSQSVVSAYENGKVLILGAFIYQISEKYQISLDWICGRSKIKELSK